jgi:hypothetical protein
VYLTHEDRKVLLTASVNGVGYLDHVLALLRRANPKAFHTEASLTTRVFFDQPLRNEPCKGFVRFAVTKQVA